MKNLITMRDSVLDQIYDQMSKRNDIFFVSADFGAPKLDKIRTDFSDRFINVGIAEQNMINVCTGLASEGYVVFAYAIATFASLRCYEQIKINLSILSHLRKINVNIIGVGTGYSYDVAGPSHHCLEDLSAMRTLPNIEVFSPSDRILAAKFIEYSVEKSAPKYIRLDGKPLPDIYDSSRAFELKDGYAELMAGEDLAIVSTGIMTPHALSVANHLRESGITVGVIDLWNFTNYESESFASTLSKYKKLITLEESYINCGGLDAFVASSLRNNNLPIELISCGITQEHVFKTSSRESLYRQHGVDLESLSNRIRETLI